MRMKSMLALVLLGAACRSGYKEEATATPAPGAAPGTYAPAVTAPPASGPTFVAQVVTIDTGAPSVTLRETAAMPAEPAPKTSAPELKAGDRTLRVEGTAATMVTTVKAGDQVRVSCREFLGTTDTTGAPATSGAKATTPATGMSADAAVSASDLGRCEAITAMTLVTGATTGQ